MHHLILAAGGADFFTATELGRAIAAVMKAVALLVVLGAALKAVKEVHAGKSGKAAQLLLGTAIVVTFLWKPDLIGSLIDMASGVTDKGVTSITETTR